MSKFPPIIDLPADAATNGSYPVFEALTEGAVVILRGVEQIIQGRRALIETAATAVPAGNVADELLAFYDDAVAPSMNTVMWEHPAVRDNLATVAEHHVLCGNAVDPEGNALLRGWSAATAADDEGRAGRTWKLCGLRQAWGEGPRHVTQSGHRSSCH